MKIGTVSISRSAGEHYLKVSGNASFACAAPVRDLLKALETESLTKIVIDLEQCEWMDSTFMGLIAMLALTGRKKNAPTEIFNASEQNTKLLKGLGLQRVLEFKTGVVQPGHIVTANSDAVLSRAENAQTVLDAHKTLMEVDKENVKRFDTVVKFVQKDIDQLKKEE